MKVCYIYWLLLSEFIGGPKYSYEGSNKSPILIFTRKINIFKILKKWENISHRKYYVFGWLMSKYIKFHCHFNSLSL